MTSSGSGTWGPTEAWRDFRSGIPDRREADDLCGKRRLGGPSSRASCRDLWWRSGASLALRRSGSIFSIWGGWLHGKRKRCRPSQGGGTRSCVVLATERRPLEGLERLGSLRGRVLNGYGARHPARVPFHCRLYGATVAPLVANFYVWPLA
jgi:hypothetical protein